MNRKSVLYLLIIGHLSIYCSAQQEQPDTSYLLPDVLMMQSGKKVNNKSDWEKARRAEIINLFAKNVQGKTPVKKVRLRFQTTSVNHTALNGIATRKEVRVYFSESEKYYMDILVYIPNKRVGPSPLFLGLNFSGNQAVNADTGITLSKRWITYGKEPAYKNHFATNASRGIDGDEWPVEQILAAGYGLATIYYGDLQIDSVNSVNAGIAPLFYTKGQTKPAPDEWGAIGVWAWGLSRAMDYIETDKDLDAKRVAVIGHSRLGKTALWAGAQDKRFALVISNDSGEGGAAITRRKYGETIELINKAFPHWFCDNFKLYNNKENELPVDFHELICLIAPRPVYVASASEDQWADPTGEYLSAYHASEVYALYGLIGLTNPQPPGENSPVGDGFIGYHMRKGEHALTPYDWTQYLHFADRFLKAKK
ncbi:MAG: hypothetical protein QM764_02310 [Chitinophagaceae bacterium]